ncbi:cation transport protein ChaC [Pseudoduganella namucuonensis]|uniref:glutathione-specific gamma-glutamylcyclotransferase n=2 Tax=Pseudoduganella namucuonensis TaxID=1035707 RepID=A0A1I7LC76_9BURK|nr:cation transport protein ChaC [Pseudoduganella namucuonensis]
MDKTTLQVTRDEILSGAIQRAAAQTPGMVLLSEADFEASLQSILIDHPGQTDIWVFGYGSLIWNPAFHFDAKRIGKVYGWHRSFCLWTSLSRGCPQQPGLTLGLDYGGVCSGVLYRIPAADVVKELKVLWRREMSDGAYTPRWVSVSTAEGRIRAVTFTINRSHSRYAGKLAQAEMAQVISKAVGKMGRCSDYLSNTVESLKNVGILDHKLTALEKQVQAMLTR